MKIKHKIFTGKTAILTAIFLFSVTMFAGCTENSAPPKSSGITFVVDQAALLSQAEKNHIIQLCRALLKDMDIHIMAVVLKQRPVEKGLILIGSNIKQLQPFIEINNQQADTLQQTTKPTTWLVNKSSLAPPWVTGSHSKIAVRITQHPIARAICDFSQQAIVSTSANPATLPPARTSLMVRRYFGETIDYIVSGSVGSLKKPTEIRDIESNAVLRSS